jgi:hypothetical protein
MEVAYQEMIFLRGGVHTRISSTASSTKIKEVEEYLVTAGAGVAYTIPTTELTIHFDYAYQQLLYFKSAQLITLTIDF